MEDRPAAERDDDARRSVALTANPLGLLVSRFSMNVELLPRRHHAAVLTPYFQTSTVGPSGAVTDYKTFGGELGYRFYTGERGANGFFVGPSLVLQRSNATTTNTWVGSASASSRDILVYGAALDIGGQHVTPQGWTVGAGVGVMILANDAGATAPNFRGSGVLPRFLFTVGYSF